MSKTYQAHINTYGSLIVIGLETSKYSETRKYNEVIATVAYKTKVKTPKYYDTKTFKKFGKIDSQIRAP